MIDITRAVAKQLTYEHGILGEWVVTLDGSTLYTLPKETTVQETFVIRDCIDILLKKAHKEGVTYANGLAQVKLDQIVLVGNRKLEALLLENTRLAEALEKHIIMSED